jgi:tetratricopeptide (TPR) repeat protein
VASFAIGYATLRRGRPAAAVSALEAGLALTREWGIGLWLPTVAASLGAAYVAVGRVNEAVRVLEEAVEQERRMKRVGSHSARLVALSEAYLAADRPHDAGATSARALELARAHGERGYEAAALRALAAVDAATGQLDAARARYADAIALARALELAPLAARGEAEAARLG